MILTKINDLVGFCIDKFVDTRVEKTGTRVLITGNGAFVCAKIDPLINLTSPRFLEQVRNLKYIKYSSLN